jgi:hypothetical protein
MSGITRRQLVQAGLWLGLSGGVISWLTVADQSPFTNQSTDSLKVTANPELRDFFHSVIPVALGLGELPAEARQSDFWLWQNLDTVLSGLPAHAQAELAQLIGILQTWAGRRWLAGGKDSWAHAKPNQIGDWLRSWQNSSFAMLHLAYQSLVSLSAAAWYSESSTWEVSGYPGPPTIGLWD